MKVKPMIDLHQDLLLAEQDPLGRSRSQTSVATIVEGIPRVVFATGFADVENPHDKTANTWIANDIETYRTLCMKDPSWQLIHTAHELSEVLTDEKRRGIIFHIEGLNAIKSEKEFALLEDWYAHGLRSIGMVWIVSNSFGGGTNDSDTSLSPLGEALLAWCESRSVIVDFAHMNRPTFWAALKKTTKPPLVTHTAAAALVESPRNLTDEQLRAIAVRGGVVGVFVSRKYILGDRPGPFLRADVIKHIEHIVRVTGIDHIGLGTDYGGILSGVPEDMPSISGISRLFDDLKNKGWSEESIEKLLYRNAERVIHAHLS